MGGAVRDLLMSKTVRDWDFTTDAKPEDILKLFRLDIKYSTIGTANENGTGLGLILCKELLEKNGEKIWVESVIGNGSIFKFTLKKNDIC